MHKQDGSQILLDTGNKYQVIRQENFPQDPNSWYAGSDKRKKKMAAADDEEAKRKNEKHVKIPSKGYKKWSQRPEPVLVCVCVVNFVEVIKTYKARNFFRKVARTCQIL